MNKNKDDIKNELSKLRDQFLAVFKLFDEPLERVSKHAYVKEISERYSALKEQMETYDKQLENAEKKGELSLDESSFLLPAIHEVALHCSAKKGSMNQQALSSSLYDGQDYLSYYIGQLD